MVILISDIKTAILKTTTNPIAADSNGYVTYANAAPPSISGLATELNATTNKDTIVTAITNKAVTPMTDLSTVAKEAQATTNKNSIIAEINANEVKIDTCAKEAQATTNKNSIIAEINANEVKIDALVPGTPVNIEHDSTTIVEGSTNEVAEEIVKRGSSPTVIG